jgi:DNA-binding transcriptional ArsR family regulator
VRLSPKISQTTAARVQFYYTWAASVNPSPDLQEVDVAVKSRFTRIPKVSDLILAGVPTEVIATYAALADHANNRTGIAWPRMENLARRLSRSPRTIQRHLHLLEDLGLVEFVERLRDGRGRFGAYVYRLVHIAMIAARGGGGEAGRGGRARRGSKKSSTTGHGGRVAPYKEQTRRQEVPPSPPKKDPKTGYGWLFGEQAPPEAEEAAHREAQQAREAAARRRREGFDWLFGE